jgi:type II secretory pathway pseudopilin PulG
MARRLLGSRAGESLVELAVSIAILSLMVLWAMSAFGAYSKTGQDLDLLGKAVSLVDSTVESLKRYSLTELDVDADKLPSCPSTNYQYAYTVDKEGPTAKGLTLITITLAVSDKATPSKSVYVVKTSFLREAGGQNVGD